MKDGRRVILCVDDDPDILQMLRMVLEKNGYAWAGAVNAAEGLAAFDELRPDALIVDLMMEQIDAGAGLLATLQARGCTTPRFLLSTVGDELQAMGAGLGVAGVFQKPVDPKRLLSALGARLPR